VIHPTALIGEPPQHREYDGESFTPELHPSVKVGAYSCIDAGIERPTRIGAVLGC
jgi:acyl-[acyl carrier protein]--UDP-N-acetylglucosamine O-acyltransferase